MLKDKIHACGGDSSVCVACPLHVLLAVYHAGLTGTLRTKALAQWSSGEVPIVIATVAFG